MCAVIKNIAVQCWLGFPFLFFPATPPPSVQTKNSIKAIKMVMLGMNGAHPPSSSTSCTKLCRLFSSPCWRGGASTPCSLSKWKLPLPNWEKKKGKENTHFNTNNKGLNSGFRPNWINSWMSSFSVAMRLFFLHTASLIGLTATNQGAAPSAFKLHSTGNGID